MRGWRVTMIMSSLILSIFQTPDSRFQIPDLLHRASVIMHLPAIILYTNPSEKCPYTVGFEAYLDITKIGFQFTSSQIILSLQCCHWVKKAIDFGLNNVQCLAHLVYVVDYGLTVIFSRLYSHSAFYNLLSIRASHY